MSHLKVESQSIRIRTDASIYFTLVIILLKARDISLYPLEQSSVDLG